MVGHSGIGNSSRARPGARQNGLGLHIGVRDDPEYIELYCLNWKTIMRSLEEIRHALTGPVMSLNTPFLSNGDIDYDKLDIISCCMGKYFRNSMI